MARKKDTKPAAKKKETKPVAGSAKELKAARLKREAEVVIKTVLVTLKDCPAIVCTCASTDEAISKYHAVTGISGSNVNPFKIEEITPEELEELNYSDETGLVTD